MEAKTYLQLSQDQIEQYHREGYLVVHGLLNDAEVRSFVQYEDEPKPEGWRQNLLHHKEDAHWRAVATHPNMTSIVRQLLGGATPMIVQTMYLEKKPAGEQAAGGQGVALHQDLHYLPCEPASLMACWIAMSDTDEENGGLCVVPGSHRNGLLSTHKTENVEDHDAWEIEYEMRDRSGRTWTERMFSFEIDGLDERTVKRLTVPRGGGVFFTGATIHGSYANRSSDRVRRAFATHFVPDGTWVFRTDVQEVVRVD